MKICLNGNSRHHLYLPRIRKREQSDVRLFEDYFSQQFSMMAYEGCLKWLLLRWISEVNSRTVGCAGSSGLYIGKYAIALLTKLRNKV
ncbi:hypothetical protein SAY86_003892 [Trapa natans]|uniref:Uncharacterized protein n=1 Tax=Trapa natans TaxID=22666 RepID=A0AAN7MDJ6_TRANT|nr:hypothetical protein SAY86_003892 [Trapa natans]